MPEEQDVHNIKDIVEAGIWPGDCGDYASEARRLWTECHRWRPPS